MDNCQESRWLSAYHDQELPATQARQVEQHLEGCAACRRELEQLARLSGLLAAGGLPQAPAGLERRVHRHVAAMADRSVRRLADMLAAAAAVVLVTCSLWLWHRWSETPHTPATSGRDVAMVTGSPSLEDVAAVVRNDEVGTSSEVLLAQWIVRDLKEVDDND